MSHRSGLVLILCCLPAAITAFAASLPEPRPCSACFRGSLKLTPNAADPTGRTKVVEDDFYFIDPTGLVWKADAGDVTDGASIPTILKPIVGDAFEADFLPAAVIHDHYTTKEHYVRSWQDTALMFYQAMVVKEVPAIKAKAMYYAVYTFGPHWGRLVAGRRCGDNCVNAAPDPAHPDLEYVREPATYEAPGREVELAGIQAAIASAELKGKPLSIEDLNGLAKARHAHDAFIDPAPLPNSR